MVRSLSLNHGRNDEVLLEIAVGLQVSDLRHVRSGVYEPFEPRGSRRWWSPETVPVNGLDVEGCKAVAIFHLDPDVVEYSCFVRLVVFSGLFLSNKRLEGEGGVSSSDRSAAMLNAGCCARRLWW